MPALKPTEFIGEITWLGCVPHRDQPEIDGHPVQAMQLTFAGLAGEVHAGLTRPSCSRVLSQYPRKTTIRNTRQISIISTEELSQIAAKLGLPRIDPAWLGASIVISGIPDFTHIPPSSRLQAPTGTTLTVDMENRPCQFPAKTIEARHPGHGTAFKAAAKDRRGVTAWVEREGDLIVGDQLRLHIPDQRGWSPEGS
ncbi:MOSC domain-containing protein [Actibacterium sp. 188UL27-1]|uniref:MOSC domain-containing protein n=1 Tax=Actibacterium sp. 188UL27-1 TaxID=2786961 RepID=UPI001959F7F8|nr:MOSC domain-containing protein [Actibacterium sp. 188UL27-1]MBM7068225.1 MOSC domain-containing protein [Actibacterium sp. 188UL27-1]